LPCVTATWLSYHSELTLSTLFSTFFYLFLLTVIYTPYIHIIDVLWNNKHYLFDLLHILPECTLFLKTVFTSSVISL